MDSGSFREQHEWPFIINATGTISCMVVVFVDRLFFFFFFLLAAVKL